MKTKYVSALILILLLLTACAPLVGPAPTQPAPTQPAPTKTVPPPATRPPVATRGPVRPAVTVTNINLPLNEKNVEHEYCQSPDVFLSNEDAQGLDESEIAAELMKRWLEYFNAPQAPDYCRVDGYRIERIYDQERIHRAPYEPQGDIMRAVQFSIRLVQLPNMWMSRAGEIDQQNWLHTGCILAIFHTQTGYTMKFANV